MTTDRPATEGDEPAAGDPGDTGAEPAAAARGSARPAPPASDRRAPVARTSRSGPSCTPRSSPPGCAPAARPASSSAPTTCSATTTPRAATSPSTSRRTAGRPTAPTASAAARCAPGPARAFGTGSRRSTPSCSGERGPRRRSSASPDRSCSPGRPTPSCRTNGQDGGLVSALLVYALEHDVVDAALVSYLEGDGTSWKAVPGVARNRADVLALGRVPLHLLREPARLRRGHRRRGRAPGARRDGLPDLGAGGDVGAAGRQGCAALRPHDRALVLEDLRRRDLRGATSSTATGSRASRSPR